MLLKIVKVWKKDQSNCGNSWTRWSKIEKLDSTRKYFKLKIMIYPRKISAYTFEREKH